MKIKDTNLKHGLLSIDYAYGRETNLAWKYRLRRRTQEVVRLIDKYHSQKIENLLDLGTADGRMLNELYHRYKPQNCVGIELSSDLAIFAREKFPHLTIIEEDITVVSLEVDSFDIIVATAVIEHLADLNDLFYRIFNALRPGGLFLATVPDPFWDRVATIIGLEPDGQHTNVPNLKVLKRFVRNAGLKPLEAKKFMLSPVGLPFENGVERVVRRLGMNFLFANQLIAARK